MDRDALSGWLKAHMAETGLNKSQLAGRAKITSQALGKWIRGDVDTIAPASIRKLAQYKGETMIEVCDWLGIPVPNEFLEQVGQKDLLARLKVAEREIKSLRVALDELTGLIHKKLLFPSSVAIELQDALYEAGYDLRNKDEYRKFMKLAIDALDGDKATANLSVLQIMGLVDISTNEAGAIGEIMRAAVGSDWTGGKLRQMILLEDRKSPKQRLAHEPK